MSPFRDPPAEIINAWELMAGLEDEIIPGRRSVKSGPLTRSLTGIESRSPMKFLSQVGSPRKSKKIAGKENKGRANNAGSTENSPKAIILKDSNSNNAKEGTKKPSPRLWASIKGSPGVKRSESLRFLSGRRILGPLFDPELLAEFEREVSEEEEEIKKMISANQSPKKSKALLESEGFLESYKRKCPPGGQNAVVLYTTTLRGIRKTFEDCNAARSIVGAHGIQVLERDISMDSGFKEELRGLMGSKEVRVPKISPKSQMKPFGDKGE
ncbi:Glutaredoxin family protein [Striga hermonthica]|uniref:Glutaredoxin family protein n=1 Tax=Striga hermonthica TaxID=68872 RepID=A0A9N7RA44_STRHE|nr:Glutaredoxin family protein [Striga hermonthica]